MVDTGSRPTINSLQSAPPKSPKIFVATLVLMYTWLDSVSSKQGLARLDIVDILKILLNNIAWNSRDCGQWHCNTRNLGQGHGHHIFSRNCFSTCVHCTLKRMLKSGWKRNSEKQVVTLYAVSIFSVGVKNWSSTNNLTPTETNWNCICLLKLIIWKHIKLFVLVFSYLVLVLKNLLTNHWVVLFAIKSLSNS